jgi:hypothetical protein
LRLAVRTELRRPGQVGSNNRIGTAGEQDYRLAYGSAFLRSRHSASPEDVKRVLAMATNLKARVMLTVSYGCGPAKIRAGGIVQFRICAVPTRSVRIGEMQTMAYH